MQTDATLLTKNYQHCWMFTCCVRLHVLVLVVASCWALLHKGWNRCQTFSYMQTGATTSNIVGPTSLKLSCVPKIVIYLWFDNDHDYNDMKFISAILLVYQRPQTHCCSHLLLNTTLSRALPVNPSAKIHGIVGLPCSLEQNKLSSAPMQK